MHLPLQDGKSILWDKEDMLCEKCKEEYITTDASVCQGCYDAIVVGRDPKVEDLMAKMEFLTLGYRTDNHARGPSLDPWFFDVTLALNDDSNIVISEIRAHKFILASRSKVFKSMFESGMTESLRSKVDIKEVSPDALKAFVQFLYTAEVTLDDQLARDLLVVAERYQVKYLKDLCENFMVSILNWENSACYYAFARQQSATVLLEAALFYLLDKIGQLHEHPYYEDLRKEQLSEDIYVEYFKKQSRDPAPEDTSNSQEE